MLHGHIVAIGEDSDLEARFAVHFAVTEAGGRESTRHCHKVGWGAHFCCEPLNIIRGHPGRLVSLEGHLTFWYAAELLLIGVLGPIEVFENDNFLNGSQLTKNLVRNNVDRVASHLLNIRQGKVEWCCTIEGVKRQDALRLFISSGVVVFG